MFDENPLTISNTAAALAIKLARDAHLALLDSTRHAWFTRLLSLFRQDFWATEASFRFIMVAYNLMSLFRHVGLTPANECSSSHWSTKSVPGSTRFCVKSKPGHRPSLTRLHSRG